MEYNYPFIKKSFDDELPKAEIITKGENYIFSPIDISQTIHPEWLKFFSESGIDFNKRLKLLYKVGYENNLSVYPKPEECMKVFEMSPDEIRCVVIGQDPYPGWDKEKKRSVACGYSFATKSKTLPGSLDRIMESIKEKFGSIQMVDKETPYSLLGWIQQGVFLLNNTPVVYVNNDEKSQDDLKFIMSKPSLIWKGITSEICKLISLRKSCPFILFGRDAEYLKVDVTKPEIESHPSKRNDCEFRGECFLRIPIIKWNIM